MKKEEIIKRIAAEIEIENDGKYIDFVVPGYAGRQFAGYHSMRADLLLCKSAAEQLLKSDLDNTIKASLWFTTIILYGKCFTDASSAKYPKLEPKDIFPSDRPKLLETHNSLMHLRHNLVAHRGSTEHEINFVYLKLNIENLSQQVKIKWVRRHRPTDEELKDYVDLIKHLIKTVEEKLFKVADKIWTHLIKNFSPDELSKFKIAGPSANTQRLSKK